MTSLRSNPPSVARPYTLCILGLVVCVTLASSRLQGLLINSTLLAAGTLMLGLPLGTLLAVAVVKTSMPARRLVEGLMLVLLFVPLYVHAAAWQAALGHGGWLKAENSTTIWFTGWTASIWVHGFAAIPWVFLFVATALRSVRPELEEESLQDASPGRVLGWVSLRGALSGIVAAALWVAVICFGEIAVTDLFQVRTFAEEIYTAANLGVLANPLEMPAAGEPTLKDVPQLANQDLWIGTGVVVALVLGALASVWSWLPTADGVSTSEPWVWNLRSSRWFVVIVIAAVMLIILVAPTASLLSKAGATTTQVEGQITRSWSASKSGLMLLSSFWEHRREWGWSLAIGSTAVVAATFVGAVLAWALRTRYLPALPTALLLALGLSIPGPLLAVWIIQIMNHPDDSFFWPLTWCYNHTIVAPSLVQFLRALPLTTLLLWSQFASISQDVLDSATSEGASWWRQLLGIALPLRWAAVIAAAAMAMIVAISDLAATLLVAPPGVSTLSMRIFGLLHYGSEDRVSALCLALAVAVGLIVFLASLVLRVNNRQRRPAGEQ